MEIFLAGTRQSTTEKSRKSFGSNDALFFDNPPGTHVKRVRVSPLSWYPPASEDSARDAFCRKERPNEDPLSLILCKYVARLRPDPAPSPAVRPDEMLLSDGV